MSSPTAAVYVLATSSAESIASVTSNPPPIVEFARVAGHILTLSFSYLSRGVVTLTRSLSTPLALLYTPVLYLLAPAIVLSQILLEIFVFTPCAIVASLTRNIYPIYVFVGAACICSALLGSAARIVASALAYALFAPRTPPTPKDETREKEASKPPVPKTRLKKRVSIREER
ncbi:hypothetical protein C8Q79DRAFT_948045 [Trametes meyenii]|nr:hypothetical protein C8Q79DRAFT_948045 [Trametes meyenii]